MNKKITTFHIFNGIILTIITFIMFYPFLQTLLTSFASYGDVASAGLIIFPWHFTTDAYNYIFSTGLITKPFIISIFVTIFGTLFQLIMTMLGAYVLSSRTLPGKKILLTFVLITMFFGGGLIPFVLLVKQLNMINSYFSLIIPFAINSFNMILVRNFIRALPYDLVEAAKIDGSSELLILIKIIIPLSLPALSTIGLYYAVGTWNDWYWPMIFIESPEKFTLALTLRSLIMTSSSELEINGGYSGLEYLDSSSKEAAVVIISIIPMLILYPLIQKYFVKGLLIGAVKG